ncbi:MAG: GHKL domain-containing protein [Intestinibaculum porci]|uniref:GHKL domain-containing protein n=1 Tax=Intestinibaculum porci TaxID=2487118 RepID=UPI003F0E104F
MKTLKELHPNRIFLAIAVIFIVVGTLIGQMYDRSAKNHMNSVRIYHRVNYSYSQKQGRMSLPQTLTQLKPRTKVHIDFDVRGKPGDLLYVKTVYAPVKVYADGKLIYEYGDPKTRPSFMKDPACSVNTVSLPFDGEHKTMHIHMTYWSLKGRSHLTLKPCAVGNQGEVMGYISQNYSFSRGISIFFLITGVILVFFAFFFLNDIAPVKRIFYSGLLIALAGLWQYCMNDLSIYISQSVNGLYLLSFSSMFMLMIPMTKFVSVQLGNRKDKLLPFVTICNEVSFIAAMVLQFAGFVDFATSFYFFIIEEAMSLVLVAVIMGYHTMRNHHNDDRTFFMSTLTLSVFMILSIIRRLTGSTSDTMFVLMGFYLFVVILIIFLQSLWKNMMIQKEKAMALENEMSQLENAIEAQKHHNELLIAHAEEVREQRHDLRHHLVALAQMVDQKNFLGIKKYVEDMKASMPMNNAVTYCDNQIINALLSYYVEKGRKSHIEMDILTQIPAHNPHISDNNLSVIVGNMIENAIEACNKQESGEKKIILRAKVQGNMLIFTMDNTFNGEVRKRDGHFVSSKVADGSRIGIGLSSVESIAHKYHGEAEFHGEGHIFKSSVYLEM